MRSQGQVRFIKLSSRTQLLAAGGAAALLLIWALTMSGMALSGYISKRDRMALLQREAKVASSEGRLNAYGQDITKVADDLKRRQDFIESMAQAHFGDMPKNAQAGETVSDSSSEAAKTVRKISLELPQAAPLAAIEARQLALIEALTRIADRRSAAAERTLARLGLNPRTALAALNDKGAQGGRAQGDHAQGGPLIALATSADGSIDPRFQRFGLSLARMDALERSIQRLPQVLPASLEFISSGFGFRSDPFTGAGAFHPGLDFRGPIGAPIFAAARGTVSFVGQRSGYGNCVEIDHGNGLMTRYAHMSGFRTAIGKPVMPGEVIGLIGSTGRSTGPHLHFEVRINGAAVNPRPFLEAVPHVLEKTGQSAAQTAR